MRKHKYMDEIDELGNREGVADETPTKGHSTRKLLRMTSIVALSVLCITGGVLIHQLNHEKNKQHMERTPINHMIAKKMPLIKKEPIPSFPVPETMTDSPLLPATASEPIISYKPEPVRIIPNETDVSDVTENRVENQQIVVSSSADSGYTMRQALMFKDRFLTGSSCYTDYQALMRIANKTPQMKEVLNNLSPYCLRLIPANESVKNAFLKNKRQALVAMYQAKSPLWLSYLKTVLVYLVEIRKLNPTTSRPKDLLYKVQNEIYQNNITQADKLAKQLPIHMQRALPDFFREAEIYLRAEESLNKLILSFGKEGK
ncbi:MAG: hypothetical protein IJ440_05190 [Alphaproteobacteria bacterium]|nr:hypothetical protein [Alphaproteobacteria bacterium]